jgi:hypothetical protein
MVDQKVLSIYDYLRTMGWKDNILTGLHLFEKMKMPVGGRRCKNGDTIVHDRSCFRPRQTFIYSRSSAASIAM